MYRKHPENDYLRESRSDNRYDHPRLSVNSNGKVGDGEYIDGWEPQNHIIVVDLGDGIKE